MRIAEVPLATWNHRERPHITRYFNQNEKSSLWPKVQNEDSERVLVQLYGSARTADPLQQVLHVYQKSWLVENLLMKADKMSMAASIELRTPFLDYRLVEWANRQPNRAKIRRTGVRTYETKSILRRFCAQRLPAEVLTRPKRGFPVPGNMWLQKDLSTWARGILTGESSRISPAFSRPTMNHLIFHARQGSMEAAGKVWLLIVLEFWLHAWDAHLS